MKKIKHAVFCLLFGCLLQACNSAGKDRQIKGDSKVTNQAPVAEAAKVNPFESKLIKKWQMVYSQEREEQLKDKGLSAQEKPYVVEKYNKEKSVIISFGDQGKGEMLSPDKTIMPFTWVLQYDNKYIQVEIQGSKVKFELIKVSDDEIEWISDGFVERLKVVK